MTSITDHTLQVPEMSCSHCTNAIEGAVSVLAGVEHVTADLDSKSVTFVGGDRAQIESAIQKAGYVVAG